jgi:hypothetical protein
VLGWTLISQPSFSFQGDDLSDSNGNYALPIEKDNQDILVPKPVRNHQS